MKIARVASTITSSILMMMLLSCSTKVIRPPDISHIVPLPIEHTIRVIGNYGMASACATNRYIITAGHVVQPFTYVPGLFETTVGYAWQSYGGSMGYFVGAGISPYRDVGLLYSTDGDVPQQLLLSTIIPKPGDILRWLEYDNKGKDIFAPLEESGTVIRTFAGHIMIDGLPSSGSSGVCIFNDKAEVVGIIAWGVDKTNVAIDLTGRWGVGY